MLRYGPALCVLLFVAGASAQDFSPRELEDMVKSSFAGCMRTQRNHPANAGADPALLEKYCRCMAHRTAARTTRAEVEAYERNRELANAAMIAKAQQIGRECQAELRP